MGKPIDMNPAEKGYSVAEAVRYFSNQSAPPIQMKHTAEGHEDSSFLPNGQANNKHYEDSIRVYFQSKLLWMVLISILAFLLLAIGLINLSIPLHAEKINAITTAPPTASLKTSAPTTTIATTNTIATTTTTTTNTTTTTRKPQEYRYIYLSHYGAYIAQFFVTWTEVRYSRDGSRIVQRKEWVKNGYNQAAGFKEKIYILEDSYNVNVRAVGCTGLAWRWWTTIFDHQDIPLLYTRSFKIKGTSLNMWSVIDPDL